MLSETADIILNTKFTSFIPCSTLQANISAKCLFSLEFLQKYTKINK